MKSIASLFAVVTAVSVGAVLAQEPQPSQPEPINNVRELVAKLHILNTEEIRAGELAQRKASSDSVKDYGRRLVQDHQANDRKLKQLAEAKEIEWTEEPELPPEKQQLLQRLEQLEGAEFDRTFLREMEAGHEKAVRMVSDAAETLKDSEARELAESTVPVLEQHLEIAKRLQQTTE